MRNAPLKVGIVGMGGIGNTHARAHVADPLSELVCVCDWVKEKADKAAETYGVEAFYNVREMLKAHPELDIVDVCTSGYENGSWHYVPVMEALDAGKHVLCEKPISNQVIEAREMVNFAAKKGLYLGCNHNHFFSQPADKAMDYVKNGQIGQQIYCINKVGFDGSSFAVGGKPGTRWNQPYSHAKAFLTHPFSVMRYFCGNVTHIQAFMDRPGNRRSAEDMMLSVQSIHMRFENGCIGYLLSQRGDAMFGLGGWWSFELAGSKGTFIIENCVEKLTYKSHGKEDEVLDTGIKDFGSTFPTRIHAFLEDVYNEVPLEHLRSSGRDALATLEYIFAAIESYEQGGALVRPNPLPPIHGALGYVN